MSVSDSRNRVQTGRGEDLWPPESSEALPWLHCEVRVNFPVPRPAASSEMERQRRRETRGHKRRGMDRREGVKGVTGGERSYLTKGERRWSCGAVFVPEETCLIWGEEVIIFFS